MGGWIGYEPVATIADLKLRPSSPLSNAIEVVLSNLPRPSNDVTPFALKSCATPPVICFDTEPSTRWPVRNRASARRS